MAFRRRSERSSSEFCESGSYGSYDDLEDRLVGQEVVIPQRAEGTRSDMLACCSVERLDSLHHDKSVMKPRDHDS